VTSYFGLGNGSGLTANYKLQSLKKNKTTCISGYISYIPRNLVVDEIPQTKNDETVAHTST